MRKVVPSWYNNLLTLIHFGLAITTHGGDCCGAKVALQSGVSSSVASPQRTILWSRQRDCQSLIKRRFSASLIHAVSITK